MLFISSYIVHMKVKLLCLCVCIWVWVISKTKMENFNQKSLFLCLFCFFFFRESGIETQRPLKGTESVIMSLLLQRLLFLLFLPSSLLVIDWKMKFSMQSIDKLTRKVAILNFIYDFVKKPNEKKNQQKDENI